MIVLFALVRLVPHPGCGPRRATGVGRRPLCTPYEEVRMRKVPCLLVAAALAATVAASGQAADQPKPGAASGATAGAAASMMMGEHSMTGTIKSIDHKSGVLKVDTKPHEMELHFPPDSIKDLKKGDKITVHLGFEKG